MAGLEGEIVLNLAENGVGAEVSRRICGDNRRDVAGMSRELVIAARPEITVVENLAAAGIGLNQWAGDRLHRNVAADGSNLDVAVPHIGQRDWTTHGVHVHVTVAHIVNIDDGVGPFQA